MDRQATAEQSVEQGAEPLPRKELVLIGVGGNLGDPVASCLEAIETLRLHPEIEVVHASSLYRTEPVGKVDQGWFVNAVALCETSMHPEHLLKVLQEIEERCGRIRRERWGPRTLDLDILSFGELVFETASLTLPHPRLHERKFVLIPLLEILPEWRHPGLECSARELLADLGHEEGQAVEVLGSV